MAIRGSLDEAGLPDVLQLLGMGRKTGCLTLTHRNEIGHIYFDKGQICYASIVNRRDRLGDMLEKNGVITRQQLQSGLDLQGRRRDRRLGEILVELGALTAEQLRRAIRVQIEEAVYFLFTWAQGAFHFDPDIGPDEHDFVVSLNPETLLLEGARRVDEWGLIEKKIPSFELVFEVDRARLATTDAALTPTQRTVVQLVDGVRNVHAIVEASGLVEFDVGKALFGLVTAGFVHRIGRASAPAKSSFGESRVAELRNLGIAFYKAGMFDEGLRELRRAVELQPNDEVSAFFVGLALAHQEQWEGAAAAFRAASVIPGVTYPAFHNLAYALERLQRLPEACAAVDEALRRGGDVDPRVVLSSATIRLLRGELDVADAAIRAARALWADASAPLAMWFHYAALCAALRGEDARAITVLTEGMTVHPRAVILANTLVAVLEHAGEHERARAVAERGAQDEPAMPQLHKNLGDLYYRLALYDEARDAYRRAVRLQPRLGSDVYVKLGNLHLQRDEREDAARSWETALELDPENALARRNLDSVRQPS